MSEITYNIKVSYNDYHFIDWIRGFIKMRRMTPEQKAERLNSISAPEPGALLEALAGDACKERFIEQKQRKSDRYFKRP